ncbi:hypothetical protein ACRAKJ_12215 [Saccharothrix sp. DSM 118769]
MNESRSGRRSKSRILSVACVLLVGLFVASVGAGYSMTKEELSNAQAVVQRGDAPVLLNTETERVEAEARALATGEQELELVTLADGRVASVNRTTKQVMLLGSDFGDQGGLNPSFAAPPQRGEVPVVVPSPMATFVLYPDLDVVEQIGDGNTTKSPVRVPGATGTAVGDSGGGLWVLTDKHEVVHVVGDRAEQPVTAPTPILHLTLAEGRPIGITEAGEALDVAAKPTKAINREPVPAGQHVLVPSAKGAGRYLVVLDRKGKLVSVDPRTGQRREFDDLPTGSRHDLGAPVVLDDVVYVPDYANHELLPRDLRGGDSPAPAPLAVPGKSPRFTVDVQERRVVANDPNDRGTLAIAPDGRPVTIDKGPGPGVETDTEGIGGIPAPSSGVKPTTSSTPSAPPSSPTNAPPPARPTSQATPTGAPATPPAALVPVPVIPPGTPQGEACELVRESGLLCQVVDVGVGGETGTVRDTAPGGGERVTQGSPVTVYVYGDSTRVPRVVGRRAADACTTVNAVFAPDGGDVCDEQPMPSPGAKWAELDVVAEQSPRDGEFAARGTRVGVRYWDSVAMPDLVTVAQDGAAACNAIIADTAGQVTCQVTQGPEGPAPGTVQSSSPAAGQPVRAGGAVVLTVASQPAPPTPAPDVLGLPLAQACAAVVAAGFACIEQADAFARQHQTAITQDPPAGTLQKGGSIAVHYSPYEAKKLQVLANSNGVHIVRFEGEAENGYSFHSDLGWAYPNGAIPDGGAAGQLHDHMCSRGASNCGGASPNHYFSRNAQPKTGWEHLRVVGLVINAPGGQCTTQGQHPISRYLYKRNGELLYTVGTSGGAGWTYEEVLGCVWTS